MRSLILLSLAVGLRQSAFTQTLLTLQPDSLTGKDCEVFSLSLTTNYNTNLLRGNAYTFEGIAGTQRGLFEFDLSPIPSNANISYARLSLFAPDSPHSQYHYGINGAYIQRITSAWTESTVTWNNQPSTTTQNQISLSAASSDYQNYLNIDVTLLVKDMITNPSTSHGFMLKLQNEQHYRRMTFCSSDYPVAAKRPKLEISYDIPVSQDETESRVGFSFSPNPVSHQLTVSSTYERRMDDFIINIYNCLGAVIYTQRLTCNDQIDLAHIPGQLLTLQISNSRGQVIISKKLIKN